MLNRDFFLPTTRVGKIFVLSAPSGCGKTTLADLLLQHSANCKRAITTTTRAPRLGEKQGVEYDFVTPALFQKMKEQGEFVETVELYGYAYGTTRKAVEEIRQKGVHVLLVIDTQGAKAVFSLWPESVLIFLRPPSFEELKKRLLGRKSEDAQSLALRLEKAKEELLDESFFHYSVVNDQIERAYRVVSSILIAECHRNIYTR